MTKPNEGDVIVLISTEDSLGDPHGSQYQRVMRVFDHADFLEEGGEGWGDDGESAWAQLDHNQVTGKTGEWYAICSPCNKAGIITYHGESCSFASYEVREVYRCCEICGEPTYEGNVAEMYQPMGGQDAESVICHPDCGLAKGMEIA